MTLRFNIKILKHLCSYAFHEAIQNDKNLMKNIFLFSKIFCKLYQKTIDMINICQCIIYIHND